ncbi:MAG: hypothetical protein ABR568_22600, partial [Pyrinomonadaceae bacterium]
KTIFRENFLECFTCHLDAPLGDRRNCKPEGCDLQTAEDIADWRLAIGDFQVPFNRDRIGNRQSLSVATAPVLYRVP